MSQINREYDRPQATKPGQESFEPQVNVERLANQNIQQEMQKLSREEHAKPAPRQEYQSSEKPSSSENQNPDVSSILNGFQITGADEHPARQPDVAPSTGEHQFQSPPPSTPDQSGTWQSGGDGGVQYEQQQQQKPQQPSIGIPNWMLNFMN